MLAFNRIPHKPEPFPLSDFDIELGVNEFDLAFEVIDHITFRSVLLFLLHDGDKFPCGEIKLYHSGGLFNYEQTLHLSKTLASEIVRRFNTFRERGQQCFEL